MKILVVDDDIAVGRVLQDLLASYHYAVDIAINGKTGLEMAIAFDYDLALLDVLLPDFDGIRLCQKLRAEGCQMPILLLTGQNTYPQKAMALNVGADDYMVKPFDGEELIARVQALLRRGGMTRQPILTWGLLSIDPSGRKVTYGTHLLTLRPKEYGILEFFLRNHQWVLRAQDILNQVWRSDEYPGQEVIRTHLKGLRKKLIAVGAPKDLIETIYNTGYRLNPLYSNILAASPPESMPPPKIAELKAVNGGLRNALEQLQANHSELCQALSNAVEGISRLNNQGHYLFVNEAYARMTGYSSTEMLGMDWQRTVHPDDLGVARPPISKCCG